MRNIAVILAGGRGVRLGENIPKQFLKVAGKKIIEHTIDVFQRHSLIDEIVVVSHKDYIELMKEMVIENKYTKVTKILNGGEERYQSSLAAINAYGTEVNLIFHDSVRPLVNDRIITNCIEALNKYNAVDVAVNTSDTIIQVNQKKEIVNIPDRNILRNGQTPQAFKLSVIKHAYEKALQDPNFKTTDDCGVVLKYLPEEPIYVIEGENFNIKLTYKEDLFLLDKLFQLKSIQANQYELLPETISKIKEKVIIIFGGSYGIGKEIYDQLVLAGANVYSFSRTEGVDVSNVEQVQRALNKVHSVEGRIDAVVCTAGVLNKQPLINMDYETINTSMMINYFGSVVVAKESFKYLEETAGALLLYTSSSYTRGRAFYSLYSSQKTAIVNFVQAISEEWRHAKVRINCINPERTKTPMRIKNFGNEPEETLLNPTEVAISSINVLFSDISGNVIDVKRKIK